MKGFIEITLEPLGNKVSININTIAYFGDNWIVQNYSDCTAQTSVKESYEEIKELIKNAQQNERQRAYFKRI